MKVLIQRVKHASVTINNDLYSSIGAGILAFVGIEKGDTSEQVEKLSRKILGLRIFSDEQGKMNKSVKDINGEMLIVSQFTLCGDCKKGTRPSFDKSEVPERAKQLYEEFIANIKNNSIPVLTGVFGAMMEIDLLNDGPVTFILEA
jgi:D-tyrosyl-tRNA(Tyr) deacylase